MFQDDPALSGYLDRASSRLEATLDAYGPHLAPGVLARLRALSPESRIASYFAHERRFPMLLLPWWLSGSLGTRGDARFHEDIVYSTIAGYAAIRLLDDALDDGVHAELLPASVILLGEFQAVYAGYFSPDHPFWDLFRRRWYGAADFAGDHDGARDFDRRVEHRLGPALIPLAAVAWRGNRTDCLRPWSDAVMQIARLEQLLDDITDWLVDHERGAPNHLLWAHAARAEPGEPVEAWVLRDGLSYGHDLAGEWLAGAIATAQPLGCIELDRFLARRREMLEELRAEATPGLRELARLRATLSAPDCSPGTGR